MAARKPREWTPAELAAMAEWERTQVAQGLCPHSGMPLQPTTTSEGVLLACSICDCLGYPGKEVGGAADRG